MRAINKIDPWAEVLALLFKDEKLGLITTDSVTPFKIEPGTVRNSKVTLMGVPAKGLTGALKVEYSRLELSKLLNKYGDTTKIPAVLVFGNPGSAFNLSNVISAINDRFDIHLTMSGNYPDLEEMVLAYPAKNGAITVQLSPKVSATGTVPFSLRIAGSNKASIKLVNSGFKLTDATTTRSLHPLKRSNNTLNWTMPDRAISATSPDGNIVRRLIDFSDVFGVPKVGILKTMLDNTSNCLKYSLADVIVDQINEKLAAEGLPVLKYDQTHILTRAAMAGSETAIETLTANTSGMGQRGATNNFLPAIPYGYLGNPMAAPGLINPNYQYYIRICMPDQTPGGAALASDDAAGIAAGNNRFWYLHYNILT